MNRAKLRELVIAEFGPRLERLTPAGAREFLDRLYREFHRAVHPPGSIIEIDESARSYEEIMAQFFANALETDAEEAALMLWLYAFEQHYATMQEEYTERFIAMFEKPETESEDENE
ncbi:MAG: hypothetical protein GTO55_00975 [Armatimonadetes bacterium]|nr:hypothetical protein [Armatimonadota bacterium]NIM22857.1 hypothetical protein [Armatimonadota bacterium]NIM66723.1 hypothetical protein [Armatimonadota bacterium]NIM75280.1 hypothetical protein [Armatimonadota bacterium]NIN04920.1 hypothetical protein [Armatimonadota bacterium]